MYHTCIIQPFAEAMSFSIFQAAISEVLPRTCKVSTISTQHSYMYIHCEGYVSYTNMNPKRKDNLKKELMKY